MYLVYSLAESIVYMMSDGASDCRVRYDEELWFLGEDTTDDEIWNISYLIVMLGLIRAQSESHLTYTTFKSQYIKLTISYKKEKCKDDSDLLLNMVIWDVHAYEYEEMGMEVVGYGNIIDKLPCDHLPGNQPTDPTTKPHYSPSRNIPVHHPKPTPTKPPTNLYLTHPHGTPSTSYPIPVSNSTINYRGK